MIDLGCSNLRHLSDSGLFVRRPPRVLRVVCDFFLAPSAGDSGKVVLHRPSKLRCEILLPSSLRLLFSKLSSSPSCFVFLISTPLSWTLGSSAILDLM